MIRIREIDALLVRLFSESWTSLHSFNSFRKSDLKFPGVYLLAYTDIDLEGQKVTPDQVFYVGMSNAANGVGQRIKQFRTGIEQYGLHSAAKRFYRTYCKNMPFSKTRLGKHFYFASLQIPTQSGKTKAQPDDFRRMGHVACLEFYAIAYVQEKTGECPALNKPEVKTLR